MKVYNERELDNADRIITIGFFVLLFRGIKFVYKWLYSPLFFYIRV